MFSVADCHVCRCLLEPLLFLICVTILLLPSFPLTLTLITTLHPSSSLYTQAKKLFLSSTARPGMSKEQLDECQARLLKAQQLLKDCKKMSGGRDFRNTNEMLSHISKRLSIRSQPAAAAEAKGPAPAQQQQQQEEEAENDDDDEEEEEEDLDAVERLKCLEVMEWELQVTCKKLQRKEGDLEMLNFRKGELETAIQILQTNVETGILTEEEYMMQVKDAIAREQRVRKRLQAQNRVKDAERVFSWIQLMCKELDMEIPPEPQLPEQQIRACGNHPMAYSIQGGAEGGGVGKEEDGEEEEEGENGDEEIEIFDDIAEIASFEVLEYEQKVAQEQKKKLPSGHEDSDDLSYR